MAYIRASRRPADEYEAVRAPPRIESLRSDLDAAAQARPRSGRARARACRLRLHLYPQSRTARGCGRAPDRRPARQPGSSTAIRSSAPSPRCRRPSARYPVALRADLVAVYDRDPACTRFIEPVLYFKGFHAIQTHRLAHWLYDNGRQRLRLLPAEPGLRGVPGRHQPGRADGQGHLHRPRHRRGGRRRPR